jgi:hypothetical protein
VTGIGGSVETMEAAALIEPDRLLIHVGYDAIASEIPDELLGESEQPPSVAAALSVGTDCHSAIVRDVVLDVDANDPDRVVVDPQDERVVVRAELVGMVGIVGRAAASQLEQDVTPNVMVASPFGGSPRRPELFLHGANMRMLSAHLVRLLTCI